MRLARTLDPVEIRILGSLMEKEQTTPEAYPLSLNSLLSACNQKSNRTPVMQLNIQDVRAAIERLRVEVFVWPVEGARVERYRHLVDRKWSLQGPSKAIMTVLLLRGAQTAGEIRARTERMHPFRTAAEVEEVLESMASEEETLVVQLPRQPGQKELRWMHLVGGIPEISVSHAEIAKFEIPEKIPEKGLSERIWDLETRVLLLEGRLEKLGNSSGSSSEI